MQTLGLLVAPVLGFYQRFLRFSLRFFLLMFMDFASTFKFITQAGELVCGFLLLGYVSPFFNLIGLLLIFFVCLRFLRSHPPLISRDYKSSSRDENFKEDEILREDGGLEDEVFDVMSLRRMVKAERQRYNAAYAEIEEEQGAAASAAEEAMAMILRLQSEKSGVEIQAKQFRRMVEQKQEYDLEVIESLRWTVVQVESQRNLLERQLGVLRERLSQFVDDQEIEELQEEEQGTAGDDHDHDDDHGNEEEDEVSSGFLNFSIELDDVDASSSQKHSPTHTPQHLIRHVMNEKATWSWRLNQSCGACRVM